MLMMMYYTIFISRGCWYENDLLIEGAGAVYSFPITYSINLRARFLNADGSAVMPVWLTPPGTTPPIIIPPSASPPETAPPSTTPPNADEIITFPDINFEKAVRLRTDKPTGAILKKDVMNLDRLDLYNMDISDITGIEHFTNLENFHCSMNNLTKMDLSENRKLIELNCSNNKLTALDLSNNINLETLLCFNNKLTHLNLVKNINLKYLGCSVNYLAFLDISNNTTLEALRTGGNFLTTLNINNNISLERLECPVNHLTMLNVTNNKELVHLECMMNRFPDISAIVGLEEGRLNLFEFGVHHNVYTTKVTLSDFLSQTMNGTKGFEYRVEDYTIIFDAAAAKTIYDAAIGDITFNAFKMHPYEGINGMDVFVLTIDSGGKNISEFGLGTVTIEIPYFMLNTGGNLSSAIAFQINKDGRYDLTKGYYSVLSESFIIKTDLLSMFVFNNNPVTYSDVAANAWYKNVVEFIAARGYTVGIDGDKFEPTKPLTRGEFTANLMKAYGMRPLDDLSGNFPDVDENAPYAGYIAAGRALGILQGDSGSFDPERVITRQEMFTLLYNILVAIGEAPQKSGSGKSLSDFPDGVVQSWASEATEALLQAGMIDGSGGRLDPEGRADRTHLAQMIYNLLTR